MSTSPLMDKSLPDDGLVGWHKVWVPYRICYGTSAVKQNSYAYDANGEGLAMVFYGGGEPGRQKAARLHREMPPDRMKEGTYDVRTNNGTRPLQGRYFLLERQDGTDLPEGRKNLQAVIIFVSDDGEVHQHYDSNNLPTNAAVQEVFERLGEPASAT